MGFIEGTQLLLRRAQRFENASDEEINQAGNIVVALDHFPLALDQAEPISEETQCSFTDYLEVYQKHRNTLLALRGKQAVNYPDSEQPLGRFRFKRSNRQILPQPNSCVSVLFWLLTRSQRRSLGMVRHTGVHCFDKLSLISSRSTR